MGKEKKNILKIVLFLGIGIALIVILFKDFDLKKMLDDLRNVDYFWVGMSMLCGLLAMISRGLRWNILIESMGHTASKTNTTNTVIFGYFINLFIPRAGELARCTSLNQVEDIPVNKLVGNILLERAFDMVILISLVGSVFLLKFDDILYFFNELSTIEEGSTSNSSPVKYIVLASILAIGIVLFLFRKKIQNSPLYNKAKDFLIGIKEGFKSAFKMKKKGLFLFHTFFIWLMYFMMTYVVFFAIPYTSHLGVGDGVYIMVVGGLGMVVPVQGGLGPYHLAVSIGLSSLGIEKESGLLFATVVHAAQTIMVLSSGGFSTIMLSLAKRKLAKNAANHT